MGLYCCRILYPAVQDCTKFPSLIANVLLQLVRHIINEVCYQRHENVWSSGFQTFLSDENFKVILSEQGTPARTAKQTKTLVFHPNCHY